MHNLVKVITPNELEALRSTKLKLIVKDSLMWLELRAFLLMQSVKYREIFNLCGEDEEELPIVYDPSDLLSMGHRYIVAYLLQQNDAELLQAYLEGEDKLIARHSLLPTITNSIVTGISDNLSKSILMEAYEEKDLRTKMKVVEFIDAKYSHSDVSQDNTVDRIQKLIENHKGLL